jgi:hypothetical protein
MMNESADDLRPRTSRTFNLISACLAFLLWGGWAYYVNRDPVGDGWHAAAIKSALTQGIGSFLLTLGMVRAVTWLYHRLPENSARIVLPALITVLVTGSCLAGAHTITGTANIISTITPAISVAFLFNVYTTLKLRRATT